MGMSSFRPEISSYVCEIVKQDSADSRVSWRIDIRDLNEYTYLFPYEVDSTLRLRKSSTKTKVLYAFQRIITFSPAEQVAVGLVMELTMASHAQWA
jgi:hypothetical protein